MKCQKFWLIKLKLLCGDLHKNSKMNPWITIYYYYLLQYQHHMLWEEFHRGIKIEVCLYILMQFGVGHEAWEWSRRESWTKALVLLYSYSPLCWGYPRRKTRAQLRALCSLLSAVRPASGRSLTHWCRRQWPLGLGREGRVWGRGWWFIKEICRKVSFTSNQSHELFKNKPWNKSYFISISQNLVAGSYWSISLNKNVTAQEK